MIKLSVILPTFRRRDLLKRCLEALHPAVQGVSGDLYEVIVADDEGSTETEALVRHTFPGGVYTKGPALGPAANRNRAASHAKAPWLIFTDDDCIPSPGWLAGYLASIREDCKIYEGRTTCSAGLVSPLHVAPINEDGGWLWSCNFMIAADVFHALGKFDESFPFAAMEDVEFRERIKDRGLPFDFVYGAAVDHPPRKFSGLREVINAHRSYIYFQIVKRKKTPSLRIVLWNTIRQRVRSCLRPGIGDLPRALALYSSECIWLGVCFRRCCKNPAPRLS